MKPRFNIVKEQQKMEDLQDAKKDVLKAAADTVTNTMMSLNREGEVSIGKITDIINSLCAGWSNEDKVVILQTVIAKLVANL